MRFILPLALSMSLLPAPLLASDPVSSECLFSVAPAAGIPGYNEEIVQTGSAASCMAECSWREWCRSVDYERATGACYIQPVGMYDVALRDDYPGHPYDHYTCEQRIDY